MSRMRSTIVVALLALLVAPSSVVADVRLPHVIGSNMVLQRDLPIPIWGWADPGEVVTVKLGSHEVKTEADGKGKWIVRLPAMPAGGPHEMAVAGKNTANLKNILIGEVWVGSGQSNMQWSVSGSNNAAAEIAAAKYPSTRLFQVPRVPAGEPTGDVNAKWQRCSPSTVPGFSAVAYFFGREIHQELDVPVGLINTSWGGTRIEPWTPPVGFASVPKLKAVATRVAQTSAAYRKGLGKSLDRLDTWLQDARKALADGDAIPTMPNVKHPLCSHGRETGLYNGMVHPLVPFAIRGALWYQGEANRGDGMMYHEKMKALINGWRKVWGQGDFPFYLVQLAPYRYGRGPTLLPRLWEAQTATLSLPNTGMAVTNDIGNVQDIHPRNKQDVGKRLALWALANAYGRQGLVYSGPLYKAMEVQGSKIRISFEHVGSGLASRNEGPLTWFEIAGEDKSFAKAQATIDANTVVVWSDQVAKPAAVRFAWHEEAEPNLMNKEGLPASSFRTDKW